MDKKVLRGLGLTDQQTVVYMKLLEIGPASVGELVKQLDIGRVSCYDTLNRLISKGLVSFVQSRGRRLYRSVDPERLLKIAEERELKAKQEKDAIRQAIPELLQIKKLAKRDEKEAAVYKTKEGIKSLFELMLKISQPIYVVSATGKALEELKFYFPQWHRHRAKNKIPVSIVFNNELKNKKVATIPYSNIKFLPKEYSSPSTLFIFGDYVMTLLWSDTPFAFLIESDKIAKSYSNYFKIIWKIAKK